MDGGLGTFRECCKGAIVFRSITQGLYWNDCRNNSHHPLPSRYLPTRAVSPLQLLRTTHNLVHSNVLSVTRALADEWRAFRSRSKSYRSGPANNMLHNTKHIFGGFLFFFSFYTRTWLAWLCAGWADVEGVKRNIFVRISVHGWRKAKKVVLFILSCCLQLLFILSRSFRPWRMECCRNDNRQGSRWVSEWSCWWSPVQGECVNGI